ncbi:hypothetical protein F5884DRAFT_837947 [Xylogone sp. PMI_703]|nr:hypothetical protein F5884DRAFT_837947 [Xylogone sp. PMI_703]
MVSLHSPSLITFGSQTTWPSAEYLSRVRQVLLSDSRLAPLVTAIATLSDLWDTLIGFEPELCKVPGLQKLDRLKRWIEHGEPIPALDQQYNTVLTPLTVIMHIVQYFSHLNQETSHRRHAIYLRSVKAAGIQGLCIGLLSAIALSCSQDEEDIGIYSAVALRLAVCIGSFVDLDNIGVEKLSFVVRWRDKDGRDHLRNVLERYSDAYISVILDTRTATITVLRENAVSLLDELQELSLTCEPIQLHGRFHSPAHTESAAKLIRLSHEHRDLQFPDANRLQAPLRSNTNGQLIIEGLMHEIAIQNILVERANWHTTLQFALQLAQNGSFTVLAAGFVDCIPAATTRQAGLKVDYISDLSVAGVMPGSHTPDCSNSEGAQSELDEQNYPANAIAITGMACKFPAADSVEEFWEILESGKSVVEKLSGSRFPMQTTTRSIEGCSWGGLVNNVDSFDHRFFHKSSREAASMDPQQRLLLEVAYHAMESSGYFGEFADKPTEEKDIGCYIGASSSDYNDNIASHPATAYSSLGTLRAFLSGRVSHHFGWTGPSITYDTACSSSMVAIHAACKALELEECSVAVAGGVNIFTSPYFYQNLKAGSFLSPTGPTKAFDAMADGYCRGEGVGLVVLKKLSHAMIDGDNILAVIAGSAVNQNSNRTSITVPDSRAQVRLYRKISLVAGIDTSVVSYVEAHGTGTPVGDPIECQSIQEAFGGPHRATTLHIGSVKGNIGHTEAASGVASLIKTVLMIQHAKIPKQTNFTRLNPNIADLKRDQMDIALETKHWDVDYRVACVNNYGAAGSNAALIVCQPPKTKDYPASSESLSRYPIYVAAFSKTSLTAYLHTLQKKVSDMQSISTDRDMLPSLAYTLSVKQNHDFPHVFTTTVGSLKELQNRLIESLSGSEKYQSHVTKPLPVVLVFGGQTATRLMLDQTFLDSSELLRCHLTECDRLLREAGFRGLFTATTATMAINDAVQLHCTLFAIQYSCAMSWIESGLHVDAIIGHSFGELTALCVSGCLSIADGLRLVAGRARLMQRHWGDERGAMIAVEAPLDTVREIMDIVKGLEIASYNGPTSYVLVGSSSEVTKLEELLASPTFTSRRIKSRRLDVLYGFHSRLTESMLPALSQLAEQLEYREPLIHLETCSAAKRCERVNAPRVVEHTRQPVYFGQAVERIASQFGPCVWLEAGMNSSVINMVRRALDTHQSPSKAAHVFQSLNWDVGIDAVGPLAEATSALWRAGQKTQFWPFHRMQQARYNVIDLPPYQFDNSRHWLDFIPPSLTPAPSAVSTAVEEDVPTLLTLLPPKDSNLRAFEFLVSPRSVEFSQLVQGHAVLGQPLCPAPLYLEIAAQAACMVSASQGDSTYRALSSRPFLLVEELQILAPLGFNQDQLIYLSLCVATESEFIHRWNFTLGSQPMQNLQQTSKTASALVHATGMISLRNKEAGGLAPVLSEFSRYERLIDSGRRQSHFVGDGVESMQGTLIYKVFSKIVHYEDFYKGVQSISSKSCEVVGHVTLPQCIQGRFPNTRCSPALVDNFIQVAGLHVNCLQKCGDNEVFVATKIERFQVGPAFIHDDAESVSWSVYSNFVATGNKEIINDIYVFDKASNSLAVMILGAHFTKVNISTLRRLLSQANLQLDDQVVTGTDNVMVPPVVPRLSKEVPEQVLNDGTAASSFEESQSSVRTLLSEILDIERDTFTDDTTLEDLGIDSLMMTEVLSDIRQKLNVDIPVTTFKTLTTVQSLCGYLHSRIDDAPSLKQSNSSSTHYTHSQSNGLQEDGSSQGLDQASRSKDKLSPAQIINGPSYFKQFKFTGEKHFEETGFQGFWQRVYPEQQKLVVLYIIEAFAKLGCPLDAMDPGELLRPIHTLPKHGLLILRLYDILEAASVIHNKDGSLVRGEAPVAKVSAFGLYQKILKKFPHHAAEHRLLHVTGSKLAECLTGVADPVELLFSDKTNRELLEEVYKLGPMYAAVTQMLGQFLTKTFQQSQSRGVYHLLEIGAGTGGTAKWIVEHLTREGVPFTYTFTDIAPSMVAKAKKTFAGYENIKYMVLDIEKQPPESLAKQFHTIISTNCIHATRNLSHSLTNIRRMLRDNGFVCLVEFTKNISWFDLVFGLLDGWWYFDDGRTHAIADEHFWKRSIQQAGFSHADWTDGNTAESQTLRILGAFVTSQPQASHDFGLKASSALLQGRLNVAAKKVFCFPGGFGTASTYNPVELISDDTAVFGLNSPFLKEPEKFTVSLPEIAGLYVEEIKRRQICGPYHIVGYSAGGVFAYEAARQLLERGDRVATLFLIDSACPLIVPPFPLSLLSFFDSINRFGDSQKAPMQDIKPMVDVHVKMTLDCLHGYCAQPMPKDLVPDTILFIARDGVDKLCNAKRPQVSPQEKIVMDWVLNNRTDFDSSGWEKLITKDKINVIPINGNHFSIMKDPFISQWVSVVKKVLCG